LAPNGFEASPELYLVYYPDVLTSTNPDTAFACSHGFPWPEDTHVPLILYGSGVRKGARSANSPSLEDISPTLAYALGQAPPRSVSGRVLREALLPHGPRSCGNAPRAAMVLVMDQCRADYLTNPQIRPALAFARSELMRHGASYANARLSYAGARTAVSHATIGTGAIPGIHGIINNNLRVGDAFPLAFNDEPRHSMNMFNLLVPTLADVMDLALDNKPIIISMSAYGRAALGMAGHGAAFDARSDKDIVLKMSKDTGLPYTNGDYFHLPASLTYSSQNPIRIDQWLAANYGIDIQTAQWTESTVIVDKGPYAVRRDNVIRGPQGAFPDGTTFTFSHPIVTAGKTPPTSTKQLWDGSYPGNAYFDETLKTPFYTLWDTDMLLRAMESEGVGQDRIADLIYYNFKVLDTIGHAYGVNSPELYAYLYTVDYCLKKIVQFLDRRIGSDKYLLVLTADHGAHNAYGDRILYAYDLFDAVEERFGENVILNDPNDGAPFDDMLYLDRQILGEHTLAEVADFIKSRFKEHVYQVYTKDEIFQSTP
ncbi:MAG: alkaline phosphatase family protein, partial [Desulfobacteraceae bacterium]|nr:alkaline phosphatase family protein [Desulfobacteraceae bacterium]